MSSPTPATVSSAVALLLLSLGTGWLTACSESSQPAPGVPLPAPQDASLEVRPVDSGDTSDTDGGPVAEASLDVNVGVDAATQPWPHTCPFGLPANGDPCSEDALVCEYGTSPDPACNPRAKCTSGAFERLNDGGCVPSSADTTGCPQKYEWVSVETPCNRSGLVCDYTEGRCGCFAAPSEADASALETLWRCDAPTLGCTSPRPRLGEPCTVPGQLCNYGSCIVPGGATVRCMNGYWRPVDVVCQ